MGAVAGLAPPDNSSRRRGVQPLRAGQGNSFLWRKLHSLSGIIPIGAFLIEHIVSNFEIVHGPLAYAQQVKFLNGLPLARVLEWAFIFIPLSFHALYGVWIAFRGRANVNVYPWAGNWMYIAQRVSGLIAFAYIIQHVWRQRFAGVSLPEHPGLAYAKVQHELMNPWMLAIYVIAMIATCFHFGYGIWLFAAKWGITPGDNARKKSAYVCGAFATAICGMGLVSIFAIAFAKPVGWVDVMPAQPNGVVMPTVPTGSQVPLQYDNQGQPVQPNAAPQQAPPISNVIPMFDPRGTVRLIPEDKVEQASRAGAHRATRVVDRNGVTRWVPDEEVSAVVRQGGRMADLPAGF